MPQLPGDGRRALRPGTAICKDELIEPVAAFEHAGHIGLEHTDQARAREVLPQGAQSGRGHDGVTDPVRKKYGYLHGAVKSRLLVGRFCKPAIQEGWFAKPAYGR